MGKNITEGTNEYCQLPTEKLKYFFLFVHFFLDEKTNQKNHNPLRKLLRIIRFSAFSHNYTINFFTSILVICLKQSCTAHYFFKGSFSDYVGISSNYKLLEDFNAIKFLIFIVIYIKTCHIYSTKTVFIPIKCIQ